LATLGLNREESMGRENELYRDKIEVSLDGRQIFSLFFAGAVIVCAVFVIGIIVGKRVEARAHVDRAGGTAAGDPLAALDRLEADAPLSFRRTLRGGQTAGGTVDSEIAAMASAQKAAQGELAPAGKAAHVAAEHGKADKVEDKKVEDKKADKAEDKKADKADDRKVVDDERAEAKPSAKPDAKADKLAKGDEADDVAAKADAKKADEKKADEKKADEKKKSKYTLQLSAFQERGEAETFLSELRAAGYAPFVVPAEVEGKGTFYRVRLGNYPSYDDAVAAKAEFERKINRIAYVTKL
jgi:DedD protein